MQVVFAKTDTQSSFPEQAIFHHIKVHFNDAINKARYITKYGEVLEIDILIPTLNLGIEYSLKNTPSLSKEEAIKARDIIIKSIKETRNII